MTNEDIVIKTSDLFTLLLGETPPKHLLDNWVGENYDDEMVSELVEWVFSVVNLPEGVTGVAFVEGVFHMAEASGY